MSNEVTLQSHDGIELHGRIDEPANPKAVAVIVHGLAEHYGRYDYVCEKLLEASYAVIRFDHRGHGRSGGKPIYYSEYAEMTKDIDLFVDLAKSKYSELPLFIVGHSMGGYGAASYGTTFPGKVNYYVISGGVTRDTFGISKVDDALDDELYVPNALGSGVCSDPAVVEAYNADPLVAKELSIKLFRALNAGVQWLTENPSVFTDPVFLVHGLNDGLVSYEDSLKFFKEIGSEDKSLRIYSGLMHEVFNEFKKDIVLRDVVEWMDDKLA